MSGTIQASVVKDSASATNNLTLDAGGNATVGNNLTVTGTSTFTGSLGNITAGTVTASGLVTGATGALYPVVQGAAQASTSGTSIDFTSIPSWVKRITVMFSGVSTNGVSAYLCQIGSGSVLNTGYTSGAGTIGTSSAAGNNSTTGYILMQAAVATGLYSGQVVLANVSGNIWVEAGTIGYSANGSSTSGGTVTLSGTLDRVRITTVNGTDTFDAGSINILYE